MNQAINPPEIPHPYRHMYQQGVAVPAGARLLFISGQGGIIGDDEMAQGIVAQCAVAFRNFVHVLAAANMGLEDVVKINCILASPEYIQPYLEAHAKAFAGLRPPAHTLAVISQLGETRWLLEIEGVAAKVD
ncbi:MAG: RidA family protein [Alphaproteobacteria bacterium]|nr:RidA family protein [Alphaproteobacteria bacterium]